jgi:hypothetical protein
MSKKVRWLAGTTGCLTAVTGSLDAGIYFVAVPSFMIVGAAAAGSFPRTGRALVWLGAFLVSLCVIPIGFGILQLSLQRGTDPRVTAAAAASVLLVGWCDVVLVTEVVKTSRTRRAKQRD